MARAHYDQVRDLSIMSPSIHSDAMRALSAQSVVTHRPIKEEEYENAPVRTCGLAREVNLV